MVRLAVWGPGRLPVRLALRPLPDCLQPGRVYLEVVRRRTRPPRGLEDRGHVRVQDVTHWPSCSVRAALPAPVSIGREYSSHDGQVIGGVAEANHHAFEIGNKAGRTGMLREAPG